MNKVNASDIPDEPWEMMGSFRGIGTGLSEALGRKPDSLDLNERHPFDVEIQRIAPGETAYPFHSHSAQWEFYYVISGTGTARDDAGTTPIAIGDTFVFRPGEAHQIKNDGEVELVMFVVADNPIGESVHMTDLGKWVVRSPERKFLGEAPGA